MAKNNPREVDPNEGLMEKLVQVNRVAKTVKVAVSSRLPR